MSDRPILFSAPMVRALLDGRKTQTRRVLKPQPFTAPLGPGERYVSDEEFLINVKEGRVSSVRFAKGHRLWVKETYTMATPLMGIGKWPCYFATEAEVNRMTDGTWPWKWTPSIFMKREHSRLTLTVTDVRVQRLQEISEEDATAEGSQEPTLVPIVGACWSERQVYANLWNHINGAGSWDANPWIVAVSFTVEKRNIDTL